MGLLLKVLGIVFIVFLLLLAYLAFRLKRWWKKVKSSVDDSQGVPVKIHLNEDLDPQWTDAEVVQALISDFKDAGFFKGKAYEISEMPQVRLLSLFSDRNIPAVIYEHDQGFYWIDIAVQYEDGTELTVSSAPAGDEMDSPPYVKKITRPDANVAELIEILETELEAKPFEQVDDTTFRQHFEKSYEKSMTWRMNRGGTTEEEFQRVAEKSDTNLDKDEIHEAFIESKTKELYTWHDACLDFVLEKKGVPVEKRDSLKSKCFIVSDNMHPEAFLEYLDEHMDITETAKEGYKKLLSSIQKTGEFFARINETFSPDLQAKKIGHVSQPICAEIYKSPLS